MEFFESEVSFVVRTGARSGTLSWSFTVSGVEPVAFCGLGAEFGEGGGGGGGKKFGAIGCGGEEEEEENCDL